MMPVITIDATRNMIVPIAVFANFFLKVLIRRTTLWLVRCKVFSLLFQYKVSIILGLTILFKGKNAVRVGG